MIEATVRTVNALPKGQFVIAVRYRKLLIVAGFLGMAACAANGNGTSIPASPGGAGIANAPALRTASGTGTAGSHMHGNALSAIPIVSPGPAIAVCTPAPKPVPPGPGLPPPPPGSNCGALQNGAVKGLSPTLPLASIPGYHAADLQAAYGLPSLSAGRGQTVAIIVAYDNPQIASDLAQYRLKMGLPACTGQCFQKYMWNGTPKASGTWGQEADVDVEMVSAVCPYCNIALVEAPDDNVAHLATAIQLAIQGGAKIISNSFAAPEAQMTTTYDSILSAPGVAIIAGAGDSGAGVNWPADSPYVTAVGGTTLAKTPSAARGFSEAAWALGGYGCSQLEVRPSWQSNSSCYTRAVADVAAVADPNTGVAIYTSANSGPAGWYVYGGTSVATAIVAGIYGLGGHAGQITGASMLYANAQRLNAVSAGSGSQLQGGLGSPNGVNGF
jgi:hypothetical protein